jgi:hypothetical protein
MTGCHKEEEASSGLDRTLDFWYEEKNFKEE